MTAKYFVIQCIGFAGTLLFFFSYQCKSNRNLFRIQFLSYFIYTIHLILLGAMTGGISYIINTFRSFCLGGKWKSAKSWGMCAVICFLQIITLVLTWSGWRTTPAMPSDCPNSYIFMDFLSLFLWEH